jgi:non-ribosomal peptide synthetase component F
MTSSTHMGQLRLPSVVPRADSPLILLPKMWVTGLVVALWIVDESDHNRLMPIGSVGELVVSGAILARENLNNTELTAEVFIEGVPWLVKAGQREGI